MAVEIHPMDLFARAMTLGTRLSQRLRGGSAPNVEELRGLLASEMRRTRRLNAVLKEVREERNDAERRARLAQEASEQHERSCALLKRKLTEAHAERNTAQSEAMQARVALREKRKYSGSPHPDLNTLANEVASLALPPESSWLGEKVRWLITEVEQLRALQEKKP